MFALRVCGPSAWAAVRPSGRQSSKPSERVPQMPAPLRLAHGSGSICCWSRATNWWIPAALDGPLNFTDMKPYKVRLRQAQEATGLDDAILSAVGQLGPHAVVLSAMDGGFAGGSMGAVVGETIARAVDRARVSRKPLIVVAVSGGARHARGYRKPDADGENFDCARPVGRGKGSLHLRAHRSHHRGA